LTFRTAHRNPIATHLGSFHARATPPRQAALTLLTGYQPSAAIRRLGTTRLGRWLSARKTRSTSTPRRSQIRIDYDSSHSFITLRR
jgi:hypothetical protein